MPLGGAADCIPDPAREQGNASARDWFRILRKSGGRHLRDSNPRGRTWTAGGSARAFQLAGLGSRPRGAFRSARVPKKKLAGTKVRPSLNREASRLGDVGSEDPFPGASPGNLFGANQPRKSVAIKYRVGRNIQFRGPDHNRELVLARLQKPQCYQRGVKLPRQRAGARRRDLAEPALRPPCAAENRGKR